MDPIFVTVLSVLVLFILAIPYTIAAKKKSNVIKKLKSYDFKSAATIRCRYISGIDALSPNTECQLIADIQHLKIQAFTEPTKTVILDYANIISFERVEYLETEIVSYISSEKVTITRKKHQHKVFVN